MKEILIIIVAVLIIISIANILYNIPAYKIYKQYYKKLPTLQLCLNNTQVYDSNLHFPNFVWFLKENQFLFYHNITLSRNILFNLDPIHLYWLIKYRRWFNKYIIINELPKYKPFDI